MPPVVSIVGRSKSGKTTLLEKLIRELKSRGYRVATIKHTVHQPALDSPEKDSWRHIQAGSEATVVSAPNGLFFIQPSAAEISLDEVVRLFGEDYDIILTEGFKRGSAPKIAVHRKENGPPLSSVRKLVAIATDEPLETRVRQFPLDDVRGLADLLEEGFIKPQRERTVLYVNRTPISLSTFPKKFLASVMLGMVSALKGVAEITSLDFFLRRKPSKD